MCPRHGDALQLKAGARRARPCRRHGLVGEPGQKVLAELVATIDFDLARDRLFSNENSLANLSGQRTLRLGRGHGYADGHGGPA
jgi:hypothetical protein